MVNTHSQKTNITDSRQSRKPLRDINSGFLTNAVCEEVIHIEFTPFEHTNCTGPIAKTKTCFDKKSKVAGASILYFTVNFWCACIFD